MTVTRRSFLKGSATGLAAFGLGNILTPSISVAQVSGVSPSPIKNIINIFLSGGHDSLQMVLPRNSSQFSALLSRRPNLMTYAPRDAQGNYLTRRTLAVSDLVAGNSEVGLHPAFAEPVQGGGSTFAGLMQAGHVKLIHQTGNASNNGSHEAATNMFFTGTAAFNPASPAARQHWLARLADHHRLASFNVFRLGPGAGPFFERALTSMPPVAAPRLSYLVFNDRGEDLGGANEGQRSLDALVQMLQAEDRAALPPHGRRLLDSLLSTRPAVDQISAILQEPLSGIYGDTHIGVQLSDVAKVMKYYARFSSSEPRVFTVNWNASAAQGFGPNFDTHSGQVDALNDRMRQLSQALSALHRDLSSTIWNQTIGVITAEFGRAVDMNSDMGTDHGWGYVSFVFGGGLNPSAPAVLGTLPAPTLYTSTQALVLPAVTDVRTVLGEVLMSAGLSRDAAFPGFTPGQTLGIGPSISAS